MHIIWGDFTDNSFVSCYLTIADVTNNVTISGAMANYTNDLSFARAYNVPGQTRDTAVLIGGSAKILVSLTNTLPKNDVGAYIQAVFPSPSRRHPVAQS